MVAYNIQFGKGIAVGSGVALNPPGFSIFLSDISSPGIFNRLGVYQGSGHWQVQNPPPDPGNPHTVAGDAMIFTASSSLLTTINRAWSRLGLDPNQSYAWLAQWASGQNGVVRIGFGGGAGSSDPHVVFMVPIDITYPNWQTSNAFDIPSVSGTFSLPVTLSAFSPATAIDSNNWC